MGTKAPLDPADVLRDTVKLTGHLEALATQVSEALSNQQAVATEETPEEND